MNNKSAIMIVATLCVASGYGLAQCGGGACAAPEVARKAAVCSTKACASEPCADKACAPKAEQAKAAELSTEAVKALVSSGTKVTVIDARTGKWDDGKRIPGARSLAPDASAEEVAKVIGSKEDLVLTYCSNRKCQASPTLAKRLIELGYKNVMEYPEGIAGWIAGGNEHEAAKN